MPKIKWGISKVLVFVLDVFDIVPVHAIFTKIITNYFWNWQVTTTDSSTNFFVVLKLFFIMGPLWLGIHSKLQAVFLILTIAIFRRIFLAFVHISIWPREHLRNKTCPWPPSNVLGELAFKKDRGCWSFLFLTYLELLISGISRLLDFGLQKENS